MCCAAVRRLSVGDNACLAMLSIISNGTANGLNLHLTVCACVDVPNTVTVTSVLSDPSKKPVSSLNVLRNILDMPTLASGHEPSSHEARLTGLAAELVPLETASPTHGAADLSSTSRPSGAARRQRRGLTTSPLQRVSLQREDPLRPVPKVALNCNHDKAGLPRAAEIVGLFGALFLIRCVFDPFCFASLALLLLGVRKQREKSTGKGKGKG
jgi:hypothetical protein